MRSWQTLPIFALAALCGPGFGQVKIKLHREYTLEEKNEILMEFERIDELPTVEQEKVVPRIYRDLYSFFLWDYGNDTPDIRGCLHQRCLKLLNRHRDAVAKLIAADLQCGERDAAQHALVMAGLLKLREGYDEVAAFFQKHDGDLAFDAAMALGELGDSRAVSLLMGKDPHDPMRYCGALYHLCRGRPADPAVLHLLRTGDAQTRQRAAYALAGSGDPALAPDVTRLARDRDREVRTIAADMGFALTGNGRLQVRPVLTALLSDESTDVRIKVACRFAAHRDAVCARTLLDLVHGGCLDYDRHSRVVSAVANLSGIHFDYGPGPNGWRITTEKNKEALRRFIEWVENIERKES